MSDVIPPIDSPANDDNIADLIWLTAAGMRRVESAVSHLVARAESLTLLLHSAHVQQNGGLLVKCRSGTHEVSVYLERAQWDWSRPPA